MLAVCEWAWGCYGAVWGCIEAVWVCMGLYVSCMGLFGLFRAVFGLYGHAIVADMVPYVGGDGPLCWWEFQPWWRPWGSYGVPTGLH